MVDVFHPGELAVQERAGVREMAEKVGRGIRREIPPIVADFLLKQPLVALTSVGEHGDVWVSALAGAPGFISAEDQHTVRIRGAPVPADPLPFNLRLHPQVGLLCVEFATGRRLRMNGEGAFANDGSLLIHVAQVYSNCQRYIQVRSFDGVDPSARNPRARVSTELDLDQQALIRRLDTFFIGSFYAAGGADASHRGGPPGFVHVRSPTELIIPDYQGNCMFQTLGNIMVNPSTGLLFPDFDTGRTLQLAGDAAIVWDVERVRHCHGAERALEFRVHHVVDTTAANGLRWRFVESSRFNPA